MKHLKPPFKFNVSQLIENAHKSLKRRVDGVVINIPFISISVRADDVERKAAREIVIRLADKRVLNASECCDDCIDNALKSLYEIRKILVDKQVELAEHADGGLYLLVELMLSGVRQFFTFVEHLGQGAPDSNSKGSSHLQRDEQNLYFSALEMLRAHLFRSLKQVSVIADMNVPKISPHMRYDDNWFVDAYEQPKLADLPTDSDMRQVTGQDNED